MHGSKADEFWLIIAQIEDPTQIYITGVNSLNTLLSTNIIPNANRICRTGDGIYKIGM